ncbi:MAG: D-glycero-beta-D-manno-heptose 1-phosphate adenylyltransferase [Deltaproteobacteria bacterium]|nr:D-glycero-beta-D-manno-heptose 1-phosphate adenylyltransferase [Deltaproteobacteria bacterium]
MPDHRDKIMTWEQAQKRVAALRKAGRKVVFTNGCFDLLHLGHLRYLTEARKLGDFLVIGLNSDRSSREIKGPGRPVIPEGQRAEILAGLSVVDAVVMFDEPDPLELITSLRPNVLVKGGDWPLDKIVGREVVEKNGGMVTTIPVTPNVSTTDIISRILELNRTDSGK